MKATMKAFSTFIAVTTISSTHAFVSKSSLTRSESALKAVEGADRRTFAASVVAIAFGGLVPPAVAEEKLDFSLPSYEKSITGSVGFGEKEAILNSPKGAINLAGAGESEKQKEAMIRAEASRKAALAEKKAKMAAMAEEDKRRAIAKQEENKRRMAELFGGN